MKPLLPLYSKALSVRRYASTSFGMRMKPSFFGAPQYLRLWITTGSDVLPCQRFRMTSPSLPPFSLATALSFEAVHSIGASAPTWKDFHFTG